MPLKKGMKSMDENMGELMHTYKEKGAIGKAKPKGASKAREVAAAIAFKLARGKRAAGKKKGAGKAKEMMKGGKHMMPGGKMMAGKKHMSGKMPMDMPRFKGRAKKRGR
jgi:hypothetical protein